MKLENTELSIISLGLGVQSTWMYFASCFGILPKADYAIMADTGGEKTKTLIYLKWLQKWAKDNNGIPIIVDRSKNLYKDLLDSKNSTGGRFSSIPAFTKNDDGSKGMLRRQCTNEYKIQVVDQAIRKLYGLEKYKRNKPTIVWKGISTDEISRMDKPTSKWKIFYYPLCGYLVFSDGSYIKTKDEQLSRAGIIELYKKYNLPIPPKSSCVFCPYMSDYEKSIMKKEEPKDFRRAVKVDYAIRNSTKKGISNPIFIHRSLKPLDKADLSEDQSRMDFGKCSSECHL